MLIYKSHTYKNIVFVLTIVLSSCGHRMSKKETDDYSARKKLCEEAVARFIKNYAAYPESYVPIDYTEYRESETVNNDGKVPNSEKFSIKHSHKIKARNGDTCVFSGYFKLEHDYFVDIIEDTLSNSIGSAYPPILNAWLDKFGRQLNFQDSAIWKIRAQERRIELFDEINMGLKSGDMYIVEGDSEILLKFLETEKSK